MPQPPVDDTPSPFYPPSYFPPPPPTPPEAPAWVYPAWQYPSPPPQLAAPARTSRLLIALLVILAIVCGAVGVTIGAALGRTSPSSSARASLPLPTPNQGAAPSQSAGVSPQGVAALVDPAIVDVVTHLSGGTAAGTGMVLTASGVILTNNHVIDGATSITVQIAGAGPTYPATVVGYDRTDDIAVLQATGASGWATIKPGNSSNLSVGQAVIALGNALGKGGTPATASGQIVALNQTITATDAGGGNSETLTGLIEMNAQIQPGDSGGPLADSAGNVIGMDTAGSFSRARRGGTATGDGFAIPINNALGIAQQIESGQSSAKIQIGARGIIGVSVRDSATPPGALVDAVDNNSPAAGAGLAQGDIVVAINGTSITSTDTLSTALAGHHVGDTVDVGWVDANGQNHSARIQLIAGPPN